MYVNLKTGKTSGARSNPAEIGTLLLEFGTLSKLTGKPVFFEKAKKALIALDSRRSALGLVGEEIDVETGEWRTPRATWGEGSTRITSICSSAAGFSATRTASGCGTRALRRSMRTWPTKRPRVYGTARWT